MALPRAYQASFTPSEVEFIASDEKIKIIPKTKLPRLQFIQGTYGPFLPPLATEVPIWLALLMKKNNKCSIICPDWLNIDFLKKRQEEEEKEQEFSNLPFHYMELSQMLLDAAPDDIPNAEQIHKILQDLQETREAKAREGFKALDDKWLGMNNLSFMEINKIRPFFSLAFNEMRKLNLADKNQSEEDLQNHTFH
ncbi:DNA replication complex GINS protein PSF2 [Cokeromyces recurvatus]|uniref:DNA replication complex GINS protein PSF2 n=1 Tax=Cokeromyces recurvatus TaxID=90255 RepID=UPI00221EF60F|nr:DNA replication complex GINS protein PSF2 [Cokeromyces recurvatus]KAI7902145.1 DNA replication complex GINS protein PSF2 [Cokeromyces recurvatus]